MLSCAPNNMRVHTVGLLSSPPFKGGRRSVRTERSSACDAHWTLGPAHGCLRCFALRSSGAAARVVPRGAVPKGCVLEFGAPKGNSLRNLLLNSCNFPNFRRKRNMNSHKNEHVTEENDAQTKVISSHLPSFRR